MLKKIINRFNFFSYNITAYEYLENFLIASVVTISAIRLFLAMTGYPQLGGGGLHIAHMLWGGLLMMLAIFIMIMFLNKEAKQLGSILGGIGFGAFIDELGKFITSDNDYFFQPTFALLYLIFIAMFLILRYISARVKIDKRDYGVNAVELLKEIIYYDLDLKEKEQALFYLEKADQENGIVQGLRKLLISVKARKDAELKIVARLKNYLSGRYLSVIRRRGFAKVIIAIAVFISISNIAGAFSDLMLSGLTFWDYGAVVSSLIVGVLFIIGAYYLLRKKRIKAYDKFKEALLVSIFLGHFFLFYKEQFYASFSLFLTASVYVIVQFLREEEKVLKNTNLING